jgi:hypothetical protein
MGLVCWSLISIPSRKELFNDTFPSTTTHRQQLKSIYLLKKDHLRGLEKANA